jgi:6-phosphogluconolactonase
MATAAYYKPNIEIVSDAEHLARRSVELFVADAEKAIRTKDIFYTAISGGNTPRRFFELLGELPGTRTLAWEKIQLFWVDERLVRPDSPSSNYRLAADTFLPRVGIPRKNIHRVPTEQSNFENAAKQYEKTIRTVFGLPKNQIPVFDLIFLGMGVEGHTGSLFPNTYASFDMNDLACVVYMLDEKLNRITLTHPVLCAASHLVVLVSGEEKAGILKEVLTSEPDEVRYPIHCLYPILDKVTWLTDAQAAKLLKMP